MNRKYILLICAGLVLVTLIAYQPVCNNGFVNFDDEAYVTNNPSIKNGFSAQSLRWAFTSQYADNWHPLTWLSHTLDYRLYGLSPLGHHLTNVLLHIASTLLLFYVLHKMTGAVWPSAFVACLFAIHPLHVESVAWVSERKDVLSMFFGLLTMSAYVGYSQKPTPARYAGVLILFSLGLMAKPMMVTLPFVLLLLDYWPLKRLSIVDCRLPIENQKSQIGNCTVPPSGTAPARGKLAIIEKVPLLVLVLASCVITYIAQKSGGTVTDIAALPLGTRISNALVAYVSYIGKMIYPGGLAVFYPHPVGNLPIWKVVLAAVLLATITAGTIYGAGRRRYLPVGWLWFLGTLVPVIGLVQVGEQAMADRYTYLPSIGIFIMLAWLAAEVSGKIRAGRLAAITCSALVITVLLVCTRTQVGYWRDSVTLFERALSVTKDNYKMHYSLGCEFAEQGRLDDGISQYRKAVAIFPEYGEIHYNLANALRRQGKIDEAIEEYRLAVRYKKDDANAYNNLGYAFLSQGKFDEARNCFVDALKIDPEHSYALTGLAQVLLTHSDTKLRDFEKAVKLAEQASSLTKNQNAVTLDALAAAYAATGRFDDAIKSGQMALNLAIAENNDTLAAAVRKRLELFRQKNEQQAGIKPLVIDN